MIEVTGLNKNFQNIQALKNVSANIQEKQIFGLVGSNGAGKSTFLRILCGIIKGDTGTVSVDGQEVYENEVIKKAICFIPDTAYFFANTTMKGMKDYYGIIYPNFNHKQFDKLTANFSLDANRKIHTFSKGMKKQVSIILGICSNTKYLLCDETFDGLDPVVRQAVKSIFADEILSREFTPVIASHNLRELEDICDHVGLLHDGGILFTKDLEEMKFHIYKIQCVIPRPEEETRLLAELEVLQYSKSGSLLTVIARGTKTEILSCVAERSPIFSELLPLSLEEIFISETEVAGYDIKNFLS